MQVLSLSITGEAKWLLAQALASYGVATQGMISKHLARPNDQYLANISLKM